MERGRTALADRVDPDGQEEALMQRGRNEDVQNPGDPPAASWCSADPLVAVKARGSDPAPGRARVPRTRTLQD